MKWLYKLPIIVVYLFIFSGICIVTYYNFRPQSIPVLSYHDFKPQAEMTYEEEKDHFIDSVENFDKQMKYIKEKKYKTLTMKQFYCWMKNECQFPQKTVLITIDDGNASVYKYVLPILKKYSLKATSFIVTSRIKLEEEVDDDYNYLTKEMMENAIKEYKGLEFHSHTHDLHKKSIDGKAYVHIVDRNALKNDIAQTRNILNTNIIAYPYGDYNEGFIEILKEEGYIMAFLYASPFIRATRSDNLYKIPRVSIGSNVSFYRFKIILKYGLLSKKNVFPR